MITAEQMKKLEDMSEKHGISKLKLMENAGYGMYMEMKKRLDLTDKKILIICGSGNNGGDGFVLAKYLNKNKIDVKTLFLGKVDKLKKESGYNYYFLKDSFKDIFIEPSDYEKEIKSSDIIIDAILGTGIKGKIKEPYSSIIDLINDSGKFIVSVDIPTGLDPDTGEIHDKAVRPDLIITFHDTKPGIKGYLDKTVVVDIGIVKSSSQ